MTNRTLNVSTNVTNKDMPEDAHEFLQFESYVKIVIPIIFGCISLIGSVGNGLVVLIILKHKQLRTTTNILILNLALADLCFIIFSVPFTAVGYSLTVWPFGQIWCKISQYMIYLCAYGSVYTLVLMTIDRFLAIVYPLQSIPIRTGRRHPDGSSSPVQYVLAERVR